MARDPDGVRRACGNMRRVVADFAHVGGRLVVGLRESRNDLAALDEPGFWAVAVTFEGAVTCARFGAGAGITWGSDPSAEWAETELKASRRIALASDAPDG